MQQSTCARVGKATLLPCARVNQSCVHPHSSPARSERTLVRGVCVCVQRLSAQDVDIIVTATSVFSKTPSMASMLINHFKMRK